MKKILDQLNREISCTENPERIVSLVPSQTELLVDMELQDRIAGITKFCVHPEGLRKEKRIVGGTKQVHFDKIKELDPDIILCNKEENTREMVLELEKIAPVHVSDVKNIEDSQELMLQYGELFNAQNKASELGEEIQGQMNSFMEFVQDQPTRMAAYLIWKKPWMAAGKDTFIDYLLGLNKFENICTTEASRYPEIEPGSPEIQKADLILLSTEPYPFKNKHKEELQAMLPRKKVEIVDGEYFSWYGSRLIKAFDYFKELHLSLDNS